MPLQSSCLDVEPQLRAASWRDRQQRPREPCRRRVQGRLRAHRHRPRRRHQPPPPRHRPRRRPRPPPHPPPRRGPHWLQRGPASSMRLCEGPCDGGQAAGPPRLLPEQAQEPRPRCRRPPLRQTGRPPRHHRQGSRSEGRACGRSQSASGRPRSTISWEAPRACPASSTHDLLLHAALLRPYEGQHLGEAGIGARDRKRASS